MRADVSGVPPGSGPLAGSNVPQIGFHSAHIGSAWRLLSRVRILDAVTQHRISVERVVMRRADGQPVTVLVVDDEPVLAEMVSMALRYEGWNITTAGDGSSAIAAARRQRPDVVVLDVMLPDMSGLDVLHKLRSENPGLPVLLLTAKDAVEDRIAGLTAGATTTSPSRLASRRSCFGCGRYCVARGDDSRQRCPASGRRLGAGRRQPRGDARRRTGVVDVHRVRAAAVHDAQLKRVLSKAQILDRVWSYDFGGRSNIVELYISYLRKRSTTVANP